MSVYVGKHPVFISHTKELEQMLYFTADLQHKLQVKGKDSGEKYDCLLRVRRRCSDLILRMYAEDSSIILMNDNDYHWVKLIVSYVKKHLQQDQQKAG